MHWDWGVDTVSHTSSSNGSGWDNYGKPCFKDEDGWKYTNPVNGDRINTSTYLPLTGNDAEEKMAEDNKDACCGFKDDLRDSVQEKYCNPEYCFDKNGHQSRFDKISSGCQRRLEEKCASWGTGRDTFGFEDERCSVIFVSK